MKFPLLGAVRRLDRYLLLNHPIAWAMKPHWMLCAWLPHLMLAMLVNLTMPDELLENANVALVILITTLFSAWFFSHALFIPQVLRCVRPWVEMKVLVGYIIIAGLYAINIIVIGEMAIFRMSGGFTHAEVLASGSGYELGYFSLLFVPVLAFSLFTWQVIRGHQKVPFLQDTPFPLGLFSFALIFMLASLSAEVFVLYAAILVGVGLTLAVFGRRILCLRGVEILGGVAPMLPFLIVTKFGDDLQELRVINIWAFFLLGVAIAISLVPWLRRGRLELQAPSKR